MNLSKYKKKLRPLRPCRNQPHHHHLLAILGGFAVWILGYWAIMTITGWDAVATLDTKPGATARRRAGAIASIFLGAYWGLMLMKGKGGAVLNFMYGILFPWVIKASHPEVLTMTSQRIDNMGYNELITMAEPIAGTLTNNPVWWFHNSLFIFPSVLSFIVTIRYLSGKFSPEERREYHRKHAYADQIRRQCSEEEFNKHYRDHFEELE